MLHDFRLAVRVLRATPIVTVAAVLSLALGIGANTAIFSLINGLLLRALPVKEPQRLATISSAAASNLGFKAGLGWNYAMWERFRARATAFDGACTWSVQRINLAPGGETQPADGIVASGDFFTTLGVPALLGRTFNSADDVRGGGPDGPVAVISYGLWQA
jgi:putative ABC transport system permease protein